MQPHTDMLPVPFADLKAGYFELKDEIDAAIERCLTGGIFINGPEVKAFSEALAGYIRSKHVITCASGTDALLIALMALDLKPGDEVIIPAFGYVSPAETAALLKAKPVFIDIHPGSFLLDEDQLETQIGPRTKAIIPVHLFGQNANIEAILAVAQKHNLYVIEDAAQSLGALTYISGKPHYSGTLGHIGCTSFFPTKNLGCIGDGGALFTDDDRLALKLKAIASHGQSSKYHYETVGINSRLDALQAAILSVKLERLDQYNKQRQRIAGYYNSRFQDIDGIAIPPVAVASEHIYHQYIIKLSERSQREALSKWLYDLGIATAVYYPAPLHLQKAYSYLGYRPGDFPYAEEACQQVLALPVYPQLSRDQQKYIADSVCKFFGKQ